MANLDGPEWLQKLEMRREKIRGKLGHEIGAGAKCVRCLEGCPGLELHFWRKICRNCKCRKDQHEIQNDDITFGWGQFEILGAIRSKPAYVKIAKISEKPVKVDFIPANVSEDIASEYLEKLGLNNIPMQGSEAAKIRKQQLEYQVPPHDLDASLCHNLTEIETEQLNLYVDKIKTSCSGQASVVRVCRNQLPKYALLTHPIKMQRNQILTHVLNSKPIQAILNDSGHIENASRLTGHDPLIPDFMKSSVLSDKSKNKLKLMHINAEAIQAAVQCPDIFDEIYDKMKAKRIPYEEDNILGPIEKFRKEYLSNTAFQGDVQQYLNSIVEFSKSSPPINDHKLPCNDPSKLILPVMLKNIGTTMGQPHNFFQQTPMRLVKQEFQNRANIQDVFDVEGNPLVPTIINDKLLNRIMSSNIVQEVLHNPSLIEEGKRMQIGSETLRPDFQEFPIAADYLNETTKQFLSDIAIDTQTIQSVTVNGIVYDKLFQDLDRHKVNYSDDSILGPAKKFRAEFICKDPFRQQIDEFVQSLGDFFVDNDDDDDSFLPPPPLPNYSTYPGQSGDSLPPPPSPLQMQACAGTFSGLTTLMEPHSINNNSLYKPSLLLDDFQNIQISTGIAVIKCKECQQDIMSGEIAVKAERAGKNTAWHPSCFVCKHCKELLADLVYFYHNKNVYCARDLALLLKIPRCVACDELIFTKEYTKAEERTYHFQHFCCFNCDLPLAGEKYVHDETSNQPVCLKCYEKFFANKCGVCNRVINATEQGVSFKGTHYHAVSCFKCVGCSMSLIGNRFCVKDNKPFCSAICVNSVLNKALNS